MGHILGNFGEGISHFQERDKGEMPLGSRRDARPGTALPMLLQTEDEARPLDVWNKNFLLIKPVMSDVLFLQLKISQSLKNLEGENAYVAEGSNFEILKISLQLLHTTGMPILDKNNCAIHLGTIQKKPSFKRLYFEHVIVQFQGSESCAFDLFWIVASAQRPDTNSS